MHEHASVSQHGQAGQYLSFRLGDDDYAVDILRVKEIRGWERVRALPDSPAYVKGVLDLRGTIVPIIEKIRMAGKTIIMIEHRLRELFRIADRVIVMNYGEKIADGPAEAVMEDETVKTAYLGTEK